MPLTLVQAAHNSIRVPLTGPDFGPGTSGLLEVTAAFANPVTAGNLILVAIIGNVATAGALVSLGPRCGIINSVAGGSLPARSYIVSVSYTGVGESMANEFATATIGMNELLRVSAPNPNNFAHPGWSSWTMYIGGVSQGSFAPTAFYQEPPTGPIPGPPPPTTPIDDTLGNGFTQVDFVRGGQGGTQVGAQAMGLYGAIANGSGMDSVTFRCAAWNVNPLFTINGDADIVIAEFNPGATLFVSDVQSVQQISNPASTLAINTTSTSAGVLTTSWGTQINNSALVADLYPVIGTDYLFAILTGNAVVAMPPPPTLSGGGSYALIDSDPGIGPNPIPLWFWFGSGARSGGVIPQYIKRRNAP